MCLKILGLSWYEQPALHAMAATQWRLCEHRYNVSKLTKPRFYSYSPRLQNGYSIPDGTWLMILEAGTSMNVVLGSAYLLVRDFRSHLQAREHCMLDQKKHPRQKLSSSLYETAKVTMGPSLAPHPILINYRGTHFQIPLAGIWGLCFQYMKLNGMNSNHSTHIRHPTCDNC